MSVTPEFTIPEFDIADIAPMPTVPKEAMVADADTEDYVPQYEPSPPNVPLNPESLRTVPLKRSPGRPKGSRNRSTPDAPIMQVVFSPTEISDLLSSILRGTTGSLGKMKPYLEMTPSEVENISKPLARWAVRTAPNSPRVAGAINKLDLLAAGSTAGAYIARVGYERRRETTESRQAQITRQRAKVVDMAGNPVESDYAAGSPNGPIAASQPNPQNASPMVPNTVPANGQAPYVSQPAIPR